MIYRDCEVLFSNLVEPNAMSGKYELVLLCQEGGEVHQALKEICKCDPEKDGEGVVRFRCKSNRPVTVWADQRKIDAAQVRHGAIVDIDAKLLPWEYHGKKGVSLWLNAVNLVKAAAESSHSDKCPFEAPEYPF